MNHNKIRLKGYQLLGIKVTVGFKKREKDPEIEKINQAVDEFKKAIMESYLGKFMFWILDRLSQMINWVRKVVK